MFWFGFTVGFLVSSFIFIMWGLKNKKHINTARNEILKAENHLSHELNDEVGKLINKLKR